jgi:hypothetical protein
VRSFLSLQIADTMYFRFVAPSAIAKSKLTKGVVGAGLLIGFGAPSSTAAGAQGHDPQILSEHSCLQSLQAQFSNMPMVCMKPGGMGEFVNCFETLSSWSFRNFTKLHPDHAVPQEVVKELCAALARQDALDRKETGITCTIS